MSRAYPLALLALLLAVTGCRERETRHLEPVPHVARQTLTGHGEKGVQVRTPYPMSDAECRALAERHRGGIEGRGQVSVFRSDSRWKARCVLTWQDRFELWPRAKIDALADDAGRAQRDAETLEWATQRCRARLTEALEDPGAYVLRSSQWSFEREGDRLDLSVVAEPRDPEAASVQARCRVRRGRVVAFER